MKLNSRLTSARLWLGIAALNISATALCASPDQPAAPYRLAYAPVSISEALAFGRPASAPPRINTTGHDVALIAPLRLDNFIVGEIDFVIRHDDRIMIGMGRLIELLRPSLDAEKLKTLETSFAGEALVDTYRLAALGYDIRYNAEDISLAISIPATARATETLRLARRRDEYIGNFDSPAALSGYLNLRSSLDYAWKGVDQGLQTPYILLDGAIRYQGIVFESEGYYQGSSGTSSGLFRREGSRAVYDDFRHLVRWTLGDLLPSGRGFSGAPQIAGLSFERIYSDLQPQRNVQPHGERTFVINRPSTVHAYVNGQSVQEIRLQPGVYNVRDFPFSQGTNNVRLVVEDSAGIREEIAFSLYFDHSLLEKGLSEFGLYAGIDAPSSRRSRNYDFNTPAASGFIRYGLSNSLTAGANFNVRERGFTVGTELGFAGPIGTVGADLAVSNVSGIGTGYALNLGLQHVFGGWNGRGRSVSLAVEHRSTRFATPLDVIADNPFLYEVEASYSQAIGLSQSISLAGRYSAGRDLNEDEFSSRLSYSHYFSQRLNLNADLLYEERPAIAASDRFGARLNLVYRIDRRSRAMLQAESRDERISLGYDTSWGEGVGAVSASANVERTANSTGFDAGISYTANRADLGVSHVTAFDGFASGITSQRTSLRVGTAIVFADGHFALSRPVYDSFALVSPHDTLGHHQVLVDPRDGYYSAASGTFGGAVEPNLSSYMDRVLNYDVPDAPVGYDLGIGNARLLPPYRSGYLVVAGSEYSVIAMGTLMRRDETPVALLAGRAIEVTAPERQSLTIFTNRAGRFGLQGLRPGRWKIEMPTSPPSSVYIDIPADAKGVVKLGNLILGDEP